MLESYIWYYIESCKKNKYFARAYWLIYNYLTQYARPPMTNTNHEPLFRTPVYCKSWFVLIIIALGIALTLANYIITLRKLCVLHKLMVRNRTMDHFTSLTKPKWPKQRTSVDIPTGIRHHGLVHKVSFISRYKIKWFLINLYNFGIFLYSL